MFISSFSGANMLHHQDNLQTLVQHVYERHAKDSGDWAYSVGLPAKSGVGGGIMALAPGKLGIAAFSPPLDGFGNSVRAQKMITDVANELNLNLYDSK
jgi:glutaminase